MRGAWPLVEAEVGIWPRASPTNAAAPCRSAAETDGAAGSIAARPIVSRLAPASSGSLLMGFVAAVFLDRTGTKFRGASAADAIAIGTAGKSAGGFAKIPAQSASAPNAAPSVSEDQARRDQRSASR